MYLKTIRTIVYPTHDLKASVAAWTKTLGNPVYNTADFATFLSKDGIDIRLTRKPWVDYPLVFWEVEDVEKAHATMLEGGATAMGEVEGGTLDEVGNQPITNGDAATGIITVPGRRLAIVKLIDGSLIGLLQDVRRS